MTAIVHGPVQGFAENLRAVGLGGLAHLGRVRYADVCAETGDVWTRVTFPNGRGVSVVRHSHSYGGNCGEFEVAALDRDGEIDYSHYGDVIGWLTPDEVCDMAETVAAFDD